MVVSQIFEDGLKPPTSDVLVGATAKGVSERHKTRETFPDVSTWIYHDGPCLVPAKTFCIVRSATLHKKNFKSNGWLSKKDYLQPPPTLVENIHPQKKFSARKCLEKELKFKRWNIPTTLMANDTSTQDSDPINRQITRVSPGFGTRKEH